MKLVLCLTLIANLVLCLFCGCRGDLESVAAPPVYTFYLQNNSQDTFVYILSNQSPDTTLDSLSVQQSISFVSFPNSKTELYFPKSSLPNFDTSGTLELFLINIDTLQKYSPQYIASQYLIAKRYDLTYHDIITNDSTVTYP
jgi:hypothetical protein